MPRAGSHGWLDLCAIFSPYIFWIFYQAYQNHWPGTADFDPLLAASLHNQLVANIPTELLEQHNATITRNWFAAWGEDAVNVRGRLSSSIIKFLENVDVPRGPNVNSSMVNIVPHLTLSAPGDMWVPIGGLDWPGHEHLRHDWVVLYRDMAGIQIDMYFDMRTDLVTYQEELIPWNRDWFSLERILRMWNHMYDTGRFRSEFDGKDHFKQHGLLSVRPETPSDLNLTLAAWNDYVEAIVQRCPSCTIGEPGLIDKDIVDRFAMVRLARGFFLEARRPNFPFIAPGLQIPTSDFYRTLMIEDLNSTRWRAVMDRDDEILENGGSILDLPQGALPLFLGPNITARSKYFFDSDCMLGGLSGLYTWPGDWFKDTVSFVLPAPLAPDGFLTQAETDQIEGLDTPGNGYISRDSILPNDGVFVHEERCPFTADAWHKPRLFSILRAWKRLIERGVWQVGPDGITGSIEKLQGAAIGAYDRHHYRLGACFDED